MRRRWWMFLPVDLLARYWPVLGKPKGLVVVRMDGIGDMVLFRRTLDHYAEAFGVAKSEITVVGCRSWGAIADLVFEGYRVHAINEHAFERNPFYRFKEALWIRRQCFAVAVSDIFFRKALTADSLIWLSVAPKRYVSKPYISQTTRPEFTYYLKQVDHIIDTGDYPTHEVTRHYRFVSEVAGKEIAPEPPQIQWRDVPAPVFEGRPYVVLNFGSNEPGRRWPFESYLALAQKLLNMGYRVAFTGGGGESAYQPELRAALNQPGVIDLIGRTSLRELMDLMTHAEAVISNDTGPAHLSLALGTPTVVVAGGGHFGSFVPYGKEFTPDNVRFVYKEMECYHCFWRCHKRADKYTVFPCVDAVSVDAVWEALNDVTTLEFVKEPPKKD